MDVVPLPRERFDEASVVLADAYLDDPGWVDVGPNAPRRRHAYARRVCRGALNIVARQGGRIWHVERAGRVAGVLTSVDPGRWPPPQLRSMAAQAAGPVLAGPTVLRRSLVADGLMNRNHPGDPHFFVWMLGVSPSEQRSGVGRALLSRALERAEELGAHAYLETANPENLPYYGGFGFERTGEASLPRGAPIWFMHRWAA